MIRTRPRDFYSLAAFFADIKEKGFYGGANSTGEWGPRLLLTTPEQEAQLKKLEDEIASIKQKVDKSTPEARKKYKEWEKTQWDEAVAVLEQLKPLPEAHPDVFLRLGWAAFRKGDAASAKPLYEEALTRATKPSQWRRSGRPHYDLGLGHLKAKDEPKAEEELKASLATGYRLKAVDPLAAPLLKKIEKAQANVPYRPLPNERVLPKEVSLFPLNQFGEVDPKAKRPVPEGFSWSSDPDR